MAQWFPLNDMLLSAGVVFSKFATSPPKKSDYPADMDTFSKKEFIYALFRV